MMKTIKILTVFIITIFLCISNITIAQEFPTYSNGLIYSPQTIKRLHFMVDSLNVQYRNCIKKNYNAYDQAYGFHYYEDDTIKISKLILVIQNGNSRNVVEQIVEKKELLINTDTNLVIRFKDFDEDELKVKTHIAISCWRDLYNWDVDFELGTDSIIPSFDGGYWIYQKSQSSYDCSWHLNFFYLLNSFKTSKIPATYNEWINYSQCMVDTSTEVIKKNAKWTGGWTPRRDAYCNPDSMHLQNKFLTLVEAVSYPIEEPKDKIYYYEGKNKDSTKLYEASYQKYTNDYNKWEKKKEAYILKKLKKLKGFEQIAFNAWKEASENNCFTFRLVEALAKYYNKSLALELSRLRKMSEICGQSHSQERHIRDIAFLSAEAGKWDIFLRTHLSAVNEWARRDNDNGLIKDSRGVYMCELEALPINLDKLFMGMVFRINVAPRYHFYCELTRLAKSMATSKDSLKYKMLIFSVLSDKKLDVFNRVVFSFLFKNLLFYSGYNDQKLQLEFAVLQEGIKDLPVFLKSKFLFENSSYFIRKKKKIDLTK